MFAQNICNRSAAHIMPNVRQGALDSRTAVLRKYSIWPLKRPVGATLAGFSMIVRLTWDLILWRGLLLRPREDDVRSAKAMIEIASEMAHAPAFRHLLKREAMPGRLGASEMESYIRNSAVTFWHQACTAKMGRDPMSVVNGRLQVHGIDRLRIADASIMPDVPSGNTMAPCVVIGERAAEIIKKAHGI